MIHPNRFVAFLVCLLVIGLGGFAGFPVSESVNARALLSAGSGPTISAIQAETPGEILKYDKFEASFRISNTSSTNPYFPYDPAAPAGVDGASGITVDALLLPPGVTNWDQASTVPCFYYQPVEEEGAGTAIGLVPVGQADWRFRFTPQAVGTWQYKVRATDSNGTSESAIGEFTCINSTLKGFIRVSETDSRFFEYSDGTPFITPLVNVEQDSPFGSLYKIRTNIAALGESGVRFVRWFPTAEGSNYYVIPYGGNLASSWAFGFAGTTFRAVDTAADKQFSFFPYYYSAQDVPAVPGARYRLTFRAKVTGNQVLRAQIAYRSDWQLDVCSSTSTYHESVGCSCTQKNDGWQEYTLEFTNTTYTNLNVALRGLYVYSDAPSPFNVYKSGSINISSIVLQRDETGQGDWGPNVLYRSDPDTFEYVDQVGAARLDEVMRLSEEYGVYHKITLFDKNDSVLNSLMADGSVGSGGSYPNNFYSADGLPSRWYQQAYTRYFVARWSYSTALHSLELGNENDLSTASYDAGFALAEYVHNLSPRHILMSNSFWGWWVDTYWTDSTRGYLMDYSDKHWYANPSGSACDSSGLNCEVISNLWQDSAAYERECALRFKEYRETFDYDAPIVRGEGGSAQTGTSPQNVLIAQESTGTYYHKMLWAHVGTLGDSCDGEWYPRLFSTGGAFPNSTYNVLNMFAAYERFMQGEPLSNGQYDDIGTDLADGQQILLTTTYGSLRAWGVRDASTGRVLLWIDNANHTWKNVADGVAIPAASASLTLQGLPAGTYRAEWWNTTSGTLYDSTTLVADSSGKLALSVVNLATDVAIRLVFQSTDVPTSTPAATSTPTRTATATPTLTRTLTPTSTKTATPTASKTATATLCATATHTATQTPSRTVTPTPDSTATITVTPQGPYVDIALHSGWNLVSLPAQPTTTEATVLFASIADQLECIYQYQTGSTQWLHYCISLPDYANSLSSVDPSMGLWLKATNSVSLRVYYTPTDDRSIQLSAGWNLVAFPGNESTPAVTALASIAGQYTTVGTQVWQDDQLVWKMFDPSGSPSDQTLQILKPGVGYWILATESCVWSLTD